MAALLKSESNFGVDGWGCFSTKVRNFSIGVSNFILSVWERKKKSESEPVSSGTISLVIRTNRRKKSTSNDKY